MSRHAKSQLDVSVGIILNDQQEILISLRKHNQSYAGYWEFPGGKLEPHETPFDGLKRELLEEVGIELLEAKPLISMEHEYPTAFIKLHALQVTAFTGTPFGKEGQTIRWVNTSEMLSLTFPEGNYLIIEKIKSLF